MCRPGHGKFIVLNYIVGRLDSRMSTAVCTCTGVQLTELIINFYVMFSLQRLMLRAFAGATGLIVFVCTIISFYREIY